MIDENDGSRDVVNSATSSSPLEGVKTQSTFPPKPATEADIDKVEERMSGFERSTIRWTRASFVVVLATAIFICLQWLEMRSGGKDTHDLALAAKDQAAAAKDQAAAIKLQVEEMRKQETDTHDLALAAKDQAESLKLQIPALNRSADATRRSANTAHDTLTRSNRPWVGVESVRITQPIKFTQVGDAKDPTYITDGALEIIIKNYGSSPALSVNGFIETYDPSLLPKERFDPKDPFAELRKAGESACSVANGNEFTKKNPKMFGDSLFPTQGMSYNSGIPGFTKRDFQVGQFVQLIGCIVYRDQFGETTHHTHYCVVAPVGKLESVHYCESNSDAD